MATIQKTTLKRFNGVDWDPVYLANSADITYAGVGFQVKQDLTGYSIGDSIESTADLKTVIEKAINQIATIDKVTIPAMQSGSTVTALEATKLTGTVSRENLPADVSGKGIEVASESAKGQLTAENVNVGDVVKVTNGKVYMVTGTSPMSFLELTDAASDLAWSRITGAPTTLAGYGITDSVNSSEVVTAAAANKILKLNGDAKLPASITGDAASIGGHAPDYFATQSDYSALNATVTTARTGLVDRTIALEREIKAIDGSWITSGTISIDRLPASVIERMYVATNEAARLALTTEQVQNGDTVKDADTGLMFFVADDTKLGTADAANAFVQYTAGQASSVDWAGVQNKPNTISGYGITDAVNVSDVVSTATAGKILTLNSESKLPASITGDAATVGGHSASYFATQSDFTALNNTVTAAETGLVARLAKVEANLTDEDNGLNKDMSDVKDAIGDTNTAGSIRYDIAQLQSGAGVTSIAASKVSGVLTRAQLPSDISGRIITKASLEACYTDLNSNNASYGDIIKLTDGKVYAVTNVNSLGSSAGYTLLVDIAGTSISWNKLIDVPATLGAVGWTDAVTTADLSNTAGAAYKGKIMVIGEDGKVHADITGDAATLGGHNAAYFATQSDMTALQGRMTTAESEIDTLQSEIKAIDGSWITSGTISIDRLPHGALERCIVVSNDEARFGLTTARVQTGDTVKVVGTGKMYFVVDDTKLASEDGYEVYTAGSATSVNWSGVQSTPTTLAGYGITDAVHSNEKCTVASADNAGKILVLNSQGKLDVSITGHVSWANVDDKPTSTVAEIDAAVATATHTNRAVLDKFSEIGGAVAYNGKVLAKQEDLDQVALGSLIISSTDAMDSASAGQMVLEPIV